MKSAGPADNSDCLVCHMYFQKELISLKHEESGVGCTYCHGPSMDHGDDELNILFPDQLFGRAEIEPLCTSCHKTHKRSDEYDLFLGEWLGKYRPNGRVIRRNSICTDCHGNHAVLSPDKLQLIKE